MQLNKLLIITFCFLQFSLAQNQKSIHQIEWENHLEDVINLEKVESAVSTVPLNKEAFEQKALSHYVFGYLPDWVYLDPPLYFQFDLLTHIALFDFGVDVSTGAISNPPSWPWTILIDTAHANGVKMIMCVVEFDDDDIHTLITNQTIKNNFFEKVKGKIETYNLDGINIDFEGLHNSDRGSIVNNFMAELTDFVHTNVGTDKEVSFAAPAVNWSGWDLVGLANSCDYLFIMGYDFHGSWSNIAGPSSPLVGGNYNITNTLTNYTNGYGAVVNSKPEKLILGVPYYGNKWRTASQNPGSTAIEYIGSRKYASAKQELGSHYLIWSSTYQTPWYTYESNGNHYQTWYDNDYSLSLKYDLAKSKNLKGVGMWALGYDKHHTELWDMLRKEFFNDNLDTSEVNDKPEELKLYQNYPNPFNPVTTIEYELSQADDVILIIYNVLGEKIATLVDTYQTEGKHSINFKANGLPSGTYLYKIKSGSYSIIKKMLLIQ